MAMRAQTGQIDHENKIYELFLNFCRCGIAGWCLEVMFTSVDSIMAGDWRLIGRTSLIMFPIYGMGALLFPISRFIDSWASGTGGRGAGQAQPCRAGHTPRTGLYGADFYCGVYNRHMADQHGNLPMGLLPVARQCGRGHTAQVRTTLVYDGSPV